MSIKDNICAGEYESKVQWPQRPVMPEVFQKRVKDISADDLTQAAEAKARYDIDIKAYEEQKLQYWQSERDGIARLRVDLEQEYGMSGHPKADLLWHKAWEQGHSCGLYDVTQCYDDLSELVEVK